PEGVYQAMAQGEAFEYGHYANALLAEALKDADSFDVIHSHLGCSFVPLGTISRTPVVHSLHIVLSVDDQWVLQNYSQVPVVAISSYQAVAIPAEARRHARVIHHGIDFDSFAFSAAPGKYLAFLGRMGPQKSPLDAIRVARAVGMPLVLAGKAQNAMEEIYF